VNSGYHTSAREHWTRQGVNVMTPLRLQFHDLSDGRMIEVSEGTGLVNEPIFGVSVADKTGQYMDTETEGGSRLFRSRGDADAYVVALENEATSD
jgi:hypothetical protein